MACLFTSMFTGAVCISMRKELDINNDKKPWRRRRRLASHVVCMYSTCITAFVLLLQLIVLEGPATGPRLAFLPSLPAPGTETFLLSSESFTFDTKY